MAIRQLPLSKDYYNYEFRTVLDGVNYVFNFRYNSRMDKWIMDYKTSDGQPIVMGIPVLLLISFLEKYQYSNVLTGDLIAMNIESSFVEAREEDLGNNVIILYDETI